MLCERALATASSLEQPDLAQDRHGVRVDVLALDLPVLERDDVDPLPLDASARGLGDDVAPAQRLLVRRPRGPLLDDQVLVYVEPPGLKGDVGPRLEDASNVVERRVAFGPLARGVVSKTTSGACIDRMRSTSCAFHASL